MATQHKGLTWAGRIIASLVVAMLTFSAVAKFSDGAATEFERLGYTKDVIVPIAIIELVCAIIYAVPQTAVLGAVLLTGYLGGATATHVRAGDAFGQFISPVVGGVLVWLGIFLRDPRLRALMPWRNPTPPVTPRD
ncbi:MAG: DoxX family protein [Planctomycetia bacterium]|nr:DoxX family protein [Planctomycetia bacterium]